MGWYQDIKEILQRNPEPWLAYLVGQQMENLPLLNLQQPRLRGYYLGILMFFYHQIKRIIIFNRPALLKKKTYLFYAGTSNQMYSLESTIDQLQDQGESFFLIANSDHFKNPRNCSNYIQFSFDLLDIMKASLFFFGYKRKYLKSLYGVSRENADIQLFNYGIVYPYLVYFYRTMKKIKPKYVITANDHNVANRCMIAVADFFDVKTVYLQHASVSKLFPSLEFDYAFLDGQVALENYRRCEINRPLGKIRNKRTVVFLSGQKKKLFLSESGIRNCVGIALNAFDDVDKSVELVKKLSDVGFKIALRWHPGQPKEQVRRFVEEFSHSRDVLLSNPRQEVVSDFISRLRVLVAGNSSIHLEAAISGVQPVYYEINPSDNSDYYGYVSNGVSREISYFDELVEFIRGCFNGEVKINNDAVRSYSATYRTEWEGREGILVANHLVAIENGIAPENLFGYKNFGAEFFS